MKKRFYFLVPLVGLTACGQPDGKTAENYLSVAQQLQQAGDFGEAKLQIDSLNTLFPKDVSARRGANRLLLQIELAEYEQSIAFLQSSLARQHAAADSLRGRFVLEKNEKYQQEGVFVHKSQAGDSQLTRTGLKVFVEETGQLYFSCTVFGKSPCRFGAVRLSAGDVFAETQSVAEDDAYNHTFDDGLYYCQTVVFRKESEVAVFAAHYADKPLKVSTIGKCNTSFSMEKSDKQAFKESYSFSLILSEITHLKAEIDKAQRMLKRLQYRLEKQQ